MSAEEMRGECSTRIGGERLGNERQSSWNWRS